MRVSVAQLPVVEAAPMVNAKAAAEALESLAGAGEHLVVFPECFLTGYLTSNEPQTRERSLSRDHEAFSLLAAACQRTQTHVVVGYLENADQKLYNSAVLIGPEGILANYRKQHLLHFAADRFVQPGEAMPRVIETRMGRIGLMICYDLRFPESARVAALEGAELIAMPTNWPLQATMLADHVARVRALENRVFLAVANRPDCEAGVAFLGRSQIIDPEGRVMADAVDRSGIFTVEVDLSQSSTKHVVIEADEYEYDPIADRRPELYGPLTRGETNVRP